MATTTELVELVCADTGLDNTAASEDRLAALARLNHAYKQIASQSGGTSEQYAIAGATILNSHTINLSDDAVAPVLANRFLALDEVRVSTVGVTGYGSALVRRSPKDIRSMQTDGSPSATSYSFVYPNILLDSTVKSTEWLLLNARVGPKTLIEDASAVVAGVSEAEPLDLPPMWHERLLGSLACVLVLERYEGREADASYHRNLYNEALAEYRAIKSREGGEVLPGQTYLFNTPDIITTR